MTVCLDLVCRDTVVSRTDCLILKDSLVGETEEYEHSSKGAPRYFFQYKRQKRCGFNPWIGKIPWRRE